MYAIIQAPSECIDAREIAPEMEAPRIEGSLGRMKLSCLQENLKRGLAIVGHAVAGKSTLPVLSHILLATDDGRLKLAATNLEVGITCWIGAKIEEEGAITIPAKLLSDVVGGLPNDKISLALDARTQTVNPVSYTHLTLPTICSV